MTTTTQAATMPMGMQSNANPVTCYYDLPQLPAEIVNGRDVPKKPDGTFDMDAFRAAESAAVIWTGKGDPPRVGARVSIHMNKLGTGVVQSYFVEHRFCGIRAMLDSPPDWHRKQNPGRGYALVFGNEIAE